MYGVDVRLPGMLTASVAHPPSLGAKPTSVNDTEALDQPGVRKVVQLPHVVA